MGLIIAPHQQYSTIGDNQRGCGNLRIREIDPATIRTRRPYSPKTLYADELCTTTDAVIDFAVRVALEKPGTHIDDSVIVNDLKTCDNFTALRLNVAGQKLPARLRSPEEPRPAGEQGKGLVRIKDIRETPLKFSGYSVSYRGGHASVRIERETYKRLRAYFEDVATRRTAVQLGLELRSLPFEPYDPVRKQLFQLLRAVNRIRRSAGLELLPSSVVRIRRRPLKPFEEEKDHDVGTRPLDGGAGVPI